MKVRGACPYSRNFWFLLALLAAFVTSPATAGDLRGDLEAALATGDVQQISKVIADHPDPSEQLEIGRWLKEKVDTGRAPDGLALLMLGVSFSQGNVDDGLMYLDYYRAIVAIDSAVCADRSSGGSIIEGTMLLFGVVMHDAHIAIDRQRKSAHRAADLEQATSGARRRDPSLCGGGLAAYARDMGLPPPGAPGAVIGAEQKTWSPEGPRYSDDPAWRENRRAATPHLVSMLLTMNGLTDDVSCSVAKPCAGGEIEKVNFPYALRKTIAFNTPGQVVALAWTPDSSRLVAVSDRRDGSGDTLLEWDGPGNLVRQVERKGGDSSEGAIAFARAGSRYLYVPMAAANLELSNRKPPTFEVWDTVTGGIQKSSGAPKGTDGLSFWNARISISPDQTRAAVGSGGEIGFYDTTSWRMVGSSNAEGVNALSWFDSGNRLLASLNSGRVAIIDPEPDRSPVYYQAVAQSKLGGAEVSSVAASPDGQLIFAGLNVEWINGNTADAQAWAKSVPTARVLNASNGAPIADFTFGKGPGSAAEWDARSRFVAFLDGQGAVWLWRPRALPVSYAKIGMAEPAVNIAISPDGDRLAVGTIAGVSVYAIEEPARPTAP